MDYQKEVKKMDYVEKEAYGITERSIQFIHDNRDNLGSVVMMGGFLAGNKFTEPGNEQWVVLIDENDNRIIVSGLSWGYAGEGPHGLLKVAKEFGFDLTIEEIASHSKEASWSITRERMKLTEDLASYIVSLQHIADGECGLDEDELKLRDRLELEFSRLRIEREKEEFDNWFWSKRIEEEPDVAEARFLMGHHIPFDEVYNVDDPEQPESTYNLYRENAEVAGELFEEVKAIAKARLLEQDKAGVINLKQEWKKYKEGDEQ